MAIARAIKVCVDGADRISAATSLFRPATLAKVSCVLVLSLSGSLQPVLGQGGKISTIVGGGPNATAALAADIGQPEGVTVDSFGNIIVAASAMNQVFKIDPQGNFSVLAGTGTAGFSGDNGPATAATLYRPWAVASDRLGNIFIVDTSNQRIRRVDASTGIITTVAGNGIYAYSGDGGLATSASIYDPQGIGLDSVGNLFIADYGNYRIRRVDAVTGIITTVAGNGVRGFAGDGGPATSAEFSLTWSVSVDGSGNLFIADTDNHRVRRVDATTNIVTTVAGGGSTLGDGGPATSAFLNGIFAVVLDGSGNLFLADAANELIRRVDHSTGIITSIAGSGNPGFSGDNGPATSANLNFPMSVAVDPSGNFLIADTFNNRIRLVNNATGKISTVAGGGTGGDGGSATNGTLVQPYGVAFDPSGNLYLADGVNERIRRVDALSSVITTVAGVGWQGNTGDGGSATSATLLDPRAVAADGLGNVYFSSSSGTIRKVSLSSGTISSVFTGIKSYGGGLTVDGSGNVFVTNTGNQVLLVDHVSGSVAVVAGNGNGGYSGDGGLAPYATMTSPQGVAIDLSGNLFIADTGDNVIRRVDGQTGIITTVAGTGIGGYAGDFGPATNALLNGPQNVAVDAFGNLFVADTANSRIRRVDGTTGVITTIAGNGTVAGPSADGGPATSASIAYPPVVAIDKFEYVYICDSVNNRIRRVSPPPNATLSATSLTFGNQLVGTISASQTIQLGNRGPQPLGISDIAVSGANASEFTVIHNCPAMLAATSNCTITVTFAPAAQGAHVGVLTITDTSSDGPQTVQLAGTGATKDIVTLSPATVNFGTILEGATSTQTVTLTNSGSSALNISKFAVVGADYAQTNTCGSPVPAGATCTVTVSYSPTSSGTNQTRIDIMDDAVSSPQSIALTGSGTEFLLAGTVTTQTIVAGNTAQYALTLTPSAGTRDTVTLSCTGAPATLNCTVTPANQTFTSATVVPVAVNVTTTARGSVPPVGLWRFFAPVPIEIVTAMLVISLLLWLAVASPDGYGKGRRRQSSWLRAGTMLVAAGLMLLAAGCGGGSSSTPTGTPQGTYQLTVTAHSSSSTNPDQSVVLTLTVQ